MFLLIVIGIALAIYFTFRNTGSQGKDIEQNPTQYYIKELRNGMYEYPQTADPAQPVSPSKNFIRLEKQDHSYCVFDDNFRTFRIYFIGAKKAQFDFIISKYKQSKGRLTATLHHIYKGQIHTYTLSTTADKILLTSTVKYQVMIASEEYKETTPKWITRNDTIFMSFARVRPTYIQEGH